MKYKGWIIELSNESPFEFEAYDPDGDNPSIFGDSVDWLISEINDECADKEQSQ